MSSRSFLLRLFSSESYFLFSSSAIILFLSLVLPNAIHSTPQPLYQFVPTVPFIIYAQTSFEPSEATTVNTLSLSLSLSAPPCFSYTHARVIVLSLRNNHTLSLAQISESPTVRNRNKLLRESGCSVAAAAAAAKQSSHTHTQLIISARIVDCSLSLSFQCQHNCSQRSTQQNNFDFFYE